ncbi:MAG TPA: YoaK family protein, partial [Acidimicrobiia bacterium]
MHTFWNEIRQTLIPARDSKHGPLPPLLIAMTLVTGLVDAFSYLVLGHVFVANMTGNIVFLGFAMAGAPGFSVAASLVAL